MSPRRVRIDPALAGSQPGPELGWDPGSVRTLADRLAETLREAIIRGDLLPGEPLRQVELSRQLRVSFAPLREAMRQLEAEGFVRFTAFQGAVVTPLEVGELRDFIDILAAIETIAARAAVPHVTAAVLEQAEGLYQELLAETDPARAAGLVLRIRLTLYAPSGRHRLNDMVRITRLNSHRWARQVYVDPAGRRLAEQICRGLIDRFRAGDIEGAARFVADTYHEAQALLERSVREMATRLMQHETGTVRSPELAAVTTRRKPARRRARDGATRRPAPKRPPR